MGIYGLFSIETGKWYVGASINIEERLRQHKKELLKAICYNSPGLFHPMGETVARFGISSVLPHLLEEVTDVGKLSERELYWVEKKSALTNGYNRHIPAGHWLWKRMGESQ